MLSVGLHCRIIGRPGRITALERFLDYILGQPQVWVCRRVEIAQHWLPNHPYRPQAARERCARRAALARKSCGRYWNRTILWHSSSCVS
jgi:hypothetical protein